MNLHKTQRLEKTLQVNDWLRMESYIITLLRPDYSSGLLVWMQRIGLINSNLYLSASIISQLRIPNTCGQNLP